MSLCVCVYVYMLVSLPAGQQKHLGKGRRQRADPPCPLTANKSSWSVSHSMLLTALAHKCVYTNWHTKKVSQATLPSDAKYTRLRGKSVCLCLFFDYQLEKRCLEMEIHCFIFIISYEKVKSFSVLDK